MLNEFYDFIAKKINSYFQTASSEGVLLKGESFCLKLDDDEMVANVTNALRKIALENKTIGAYEYQCSSGLIYNTFTLKILDDEVVVASQIGDEITNDFLGANIRNHTKLLGKTLLMISSNPIDSAKSGSRDMSAKGMPFYADQLIAEIEKQAKESTSLSNTEKRILQFELNRRDTDVFSDKASIYEYEDLLAIMSSGKIDTDNFCGFRLFAIDGKNDYQNYNNSQIDKQIKDNNTLFEKIDRGIRFGNLEEELGKIFEESMILKIEKEYKKEPEFWSRSFTYAELLAAMETKKEKTENPLCIDNDSIEVYGEFPLNSIVQNEGFWIRNEGSQTAKKRTKSILIFNPAKYASIFMKIACNIKITNAAVSSDDAVFSKEGKNLIFEFNRNDISFHKIQVSDLANGIKYILKIGIVDIASTYMMSSIKHCFTIDYKKTKKNCKIKLSGVDTNLIFNNNGRNVETKKLEDNCTYSCKYDDRLVLCSTEEELADFGTGIKIEVNFAGVMVPFSLYPDEPKSTEIIGRKIFKDKFGTKKSFEFENEAILSETQEYFAKTNLLRELKTEQVFVEQEIMYATVKNFYEYDETQIKKKEIVVAPELEETYVKMLHLFRKNKTVPTLAYLGGDLRVAVEDFLKVFEQCFENLQDGDNLSLEQENALLIGTISQGIDGEEVLMTPFHPLNLKYQMSLLEESGIEMATDIVVDRLNSANLLPYIQRFKKIYKVSDQLHSLEWKYYAPVENKKYRGCRRFVPKLIEEKISEFLSHFKYIFDDINNRTIKINLINMGDCNEVLVGLAQYFIKTVSKNPDVECLKKFEVHIYTDDITNNAFTNLKEYSNLKEYLQSQKLSVASGTAMNSLEGIMSKNIECYFHKDTGKKYEYAHISFYEMESEITSEQATMKQIETGVSLGGILSGIPSSKYGQKYRTGFGTKYAEPTELVSLAAKYNALMQVEKTGNPYYAGTSISTQIDEKAEAKMDYIYKKSNWVVFVEPKVDLDFFCEKEAKSDLLIIHYSDQYTSSSGYDAITVTHKSQQYSRVIKEYLKTKGVEAELEDVHRIINLFNAVNGDWLLRLVSSKKGNKDSTFSREKISIVAAIKFMLAYLKHEDIIWIPISLEEMLRVSGGAGLSKGEGVLSAKNLGFEKGPTSDDLLFVGLNQSENIPKIYLYPVEVKTGNNDNGVIKKAFEQASATAKGLHDAFSPGADLERTIYYKVNRNFLMQLIVTSCKKMQVYHVDDSQDWDIVLDRFREALLSEKYVLSEDIQEVLGKAAVLSFRKSIVSRRTSFKEDTINFIEMPETDEFGLILKEVISIYDDIQSKDSQEMLILEKCSIENLTGDLSKIEATLLQEEDEDESEDIIENMEGDNKEEVTRDVDTIVDIDVAQENETNDEIYTGMNVLFGYNDQDGKPVVWLPNDTTQLFHTNTGIIGTMGTGKTQFTKSLITQLYREQGNNVEGKELGILIFDYKGDYNESKKDFVEATNAKILKPYHLPFNPLSLTKSNVFKPLLPVHTANAFKDTISKGFGLGPKQQDALFQCILETYQASGIMPADSASWENEAPTFEQVYQRYANDEDIKKNDSLATAMNKLHQFEVFEAVPGNTKSLFEVLQGVVVIDLSGYDADIQSLIVAITLELFYSQMQATGSSIMEDNFRQLTKLILVDEADNFMSQGFPALKKILKEGREFGVGTILSTQFLKHFGSGEDDYSKYILTWIVHNVSDLKNSDVDFVFKTEPKSQENQVIFNEIKALQKHHSIVKIGNNKPVYMKDKAFWELMQEIN